MVSRMFVAVDLELILQMSDSLPYVFLSGGYVIEY